MCDPSNTAALCPLTYFKVTDVTIMKYYENSMSLLVVIVKLLVLYNKVLLICFIKGFQAGWTSVC